jgi:molybdopterin converting factor subunit 1
LNATQPAANGQAIELFKSFFSYGDVECSVVLNRPSKAGFPDCTAQVETVLLAPSSFTRYNSPVPPVSQAIRVRVLFFGRLKEITGHAEDTAEFTDAATIEQLFGLYAARHPELAKYRSSVVASRNQEFAAWDTPLRGSDEIAFLPPVSGG